MGRFAGVLHKLLRWPPARVGALLALLAGAGAGLSSGRALAALPPPLATPPPAGTAAATAGNTTQMVSQDLHAFGPLGKLTITDNGNTTTSTVSSGAVYEVPGLVKAEADTISETTDNKTKATTKVSASGSVKLTVEAIRVLARKIDLDMQNGNVTATDIRVGKVPLYIDASSVSDGNGLQLNNPTIFFNEPDAFGVNLVANTATYHGDTQNVTLQGATIRIGSVPIFYLPSYTQGREDQPPLSLQDHFGYRSDLGAYAQTTTFWTQNPVYQPGMLLDYYSNRGVLAGPAFKYKYTDDPDWKQEGTMEAGYIHDTGNNNLDLNNQPIPTDRFFIDWQHKGAVDGWLDVTSSLYWWSDSNVLRDFRQSLWEPNQLPDNFVEAVHQNEDSQISAFVRYRPNNFEAIQQRLPEVDYNYFSTQIGQTGIYQEGAADYVQLEQQSFNGTPTLHSNRLDGYYGWRRPIAIGNDIATFTPVVGTRITDYMDTVNNTGQYTRVLGQFGFDADARAVGRWDYTNDTWGINGIQHIVRPILQYRYIPSAQQGRAEIPIIDQQVYSPYPPILDLGDKRSIDQLFNTNEVRYGVENILQTRDSQYGSRDLATLDIYHDYHFEQGPNQGELSDLWTGGTLTPTDWLHLDLFNRINPSTFTEREIRAGMSIQDGDQWSMSMYSDYLQHTLAQYGVEARYKISERYQLLGRWLYDEHLGELTEQTYGLRQRLGSSWDVEWAITYDRGTQNQDGIGINVRFTLLSY